MSKKSLVIVGVGCATTLVAAFLLLANPTPPAAETLAPKPVAASEKARPARTPSPSPAPAPLSRRALASGAYGAPTARALEFSYEARYATEMKHREGGRGAAPTQTLAGKLRLVILDRRKDELLVEVTFPESKGVMDTGETTIPLDALCQEIARPMVVRLKNDGEVLGYRFGGASTDARRIVRTLVSDMLFRIPADASGRWETTETDATGRFTAIYEDRGEEDGNRRIERTKTAYRQVATGDAKTRVGGGAHGVLGAKAGWISSVEVDESLAMDIPEASMSIKYAVSCRFTLESWTDPKTVPFRAVEWDVEDEAAAEGRLDARDVTTTEFQDFDVDRFLGSLRELGVRTQDVDHDERTEVMQTLGELIRARPEVLAKLREFAFDPTSPPESVRLLLAGIGASDTRAAEGLLTEAVSNEQLSEELRMAAASSTLGFSRPGPELLTALEARVFDAEGSEKMRRASLLVLGACHRHANGPESMKRLMALEADSREKGRLGTWLGALGNAGGPVALEAGARYLSDSSPELRRAATRALRHVKDAKVPAMLRKTLETEKDPAVRREAARILAGRKDAEGLKVAGDLLSSGSTRMRLEALQGLGSQRVENPEALRLIENAARSNDDALVRQAAQALLERR